MEQLLALGTVVKADLGEKNTALLMIAGYYPQEQSGRVYDYLTVMYPFGMCFTNAVQMVDKEAILSVEADGYLDEATEEFTKGLPELLELAKQSVLEEIREQQNKQETETPFG